MKIIPLFAILFVFILSLIISVTPIYEFDDTGSDLVEQTLFQKITIDDNGPRESWGKTLGDINGDGLVDIVVGGQHRKEYSIFERVLIKLGIHKADYEGAELVWYENPKWKKHVISEEYRNRTDVEVTDIDNDGKADVITLTNRGIIWLKSPDWTPSIISNKKFHDIEIRDLDGDSIKEVIARNQSLFGYGNGDKVYIYSKSSDSNWTSQILNVPHGEGLAVDDVNGDNFPDIVVNQVWLKNPAVDNNKQWLSRIYITDWKWDDVKIQVADIDGDQQNDIVLSPSEPVQKKYHISWFKSENINSEIKWTEHIIDPNVETVHHSLAAFDFDNDDDVDILTAEMNQGQSGKIVLYKNNKHGEVWDKYIIGSGGLHNIIAGDIDGDYDIDFIGTNWKNADGSQVYPVKLWLNSSHNNQWQHKVLNDGLSENTLFVFTADVDNDGDTDILTGDYVFRNTGKPNYSFVREDISPANNNIVHVYDYDHDGDADILISKWQKYKYQPGILRKILFKLGIYGDDERLQGNKFLLGLNDGNGDFDIINNIPDAKGDFLQGINIVNIAGVEHVVLSWHKAGYGIQTYKIPKSSVYDRWEWNVLSQVSQDEAISVGDIDKDGEQDLLLGTIWLKNNRLEPWLASDLTKTTEKPDRNILRDINSDNKLDAIVGYEAISRLGEVVWYEQGERPDTEWKEHTIASIIGPMSLDVGDIDLDGDLDVVAGEHNLKYPKLSRVFVFYNDIKNRNKWNINVIHEGNEHHDGTKLFDYDNDGDLDIVSIGFSHGVLSLYINPLK